MVLKTRPTRAAGRQVSISIQSASQIKSSMTSMRLKVLNEHPEVKPSLMKSTDQIAIYYRAAAMTDRSMVSVFRGKVNGRCRGYGLVCSPSDRLDRHLKRKRIRPIYRRNIGLSKPLSLLIAFEINTFWWPSRKPMMVLKSLVLQYYEYMVQFSKLEVD